MALNSETLQRVVALQTKRLSGTPLSVEEEQFLTVHNALLTPPPKTTDPFEAWGEEIDRHPIGRGPGPCGGIATD